MISKTRNDHFNNEETSDSSVKLLKPTLRLNQCIQTALWRV